MADERMSIPGVIGTSPEAERRSRRHLELEFGGEGDFDDPSPRLWTRFRPKAAHRSGEKELQREIDVALGR